MNSFFHTCGLQRLAYQELPASKMLISFLLVWLEDLDAYMTNNECTKDYVLASLPLQPLADIPCATNVCTQAFDVIKDVDIPKNPNLDAMTSLIVNGGNCHRQLASRSKYNHLVHILGLRNHNLAFLVSTESFFAIIRSKIRTAWWVLNAWNDAWCC